MKQCRKCKEWKTLSEFSKNKENKDKHCSRCKECDQKYYLENKEKIKEYQARYRLGNKKVKKDYDKNNYLENPEKMRAESKKYRLENPQKINEYYLNIAREKKWLELFMTNDGCCMWCFETNPFMLNNHHIWGKKNSEETFTFCENHHAIFSRNRNGLFEFLADL